LRKLIFYFLFNLFNLLLIMIKMNKVNKVVPPMIRGIGKELLLS
jgi:hypothetical protein